MMKNLNATGSAGLSLSVLAVTFKVVEMEIVLVRLYNGTMYYEGPASGCMSITCTRGLNSAISSCSMPTGLARDTEFINVS